MELNEEIFKAIFLNDLDGLRRIFVKRKIGTWNLMDRRGMAPIHYAAFRGNFEIVSWLVAEGADVNYGKNKYPNSPLHFAALNGSVDVCKLLLEAGARRHVTNSIGRTASEIAVDTGNFQCAKLINNYLPRGEVMCFAALDSAESEPKLAPAMAELVYKYVMMTNIHPVKVIYEMPNVFLTKDHALKIFDVLHLLSRREFEKHHDTKEMLSFKFHYLATMLIEIAKPNDVGNKKPSDLKDAFTQKISKSHNFLDQFLHDCIVRFSFKDSTLFRRMVSYMTQGMDSMRSLDIILLVIGNKRAQTGESANKLPIVCGACEDINVSKKCSKCKTVQYCSRECVRIHAAMHKKECKQIREEIKALKASDETSAWARCLSKLGFKQN
ncbi:ankyrin repeat and MYND domain-containing protein 2-like [Rhopalosiphum padi]|uniref:ankyrin repeat and MYND domain-containing protein 2-like n=1 Tax=Rhopalosiphum padi TaxID=40932 RepID=UPI00298D77B5|nr:ankyrin repeat and MYND domain-containing protein 2-like [Rhopalosiphum padi]